MASKEGSFAWHEGNGNDDEVNRDVNYYIKTNFNTDKFDLNAQKNDAFFASALGKQTKPVLTEEDDDSG
jgi:hypothetical protein